MVIDDPEKFFTDKILCSSPRADNFSCFFEYLWENYSQIVFLYAFTRLRNIENAQDVCQDAYLKAMIWCKENKTKKPSKINFPGWLQRIVKHLIIDQRRRTAVVRELPAFSSSHDDDQTMMADIPDSDIPTPFEVFEKKESIAILRHCIESLSEKRRNIINLFHIKNFTYDDIAQQAIIPKNTVGVELFRARAELRQCMEIQHSI